VSRLSLKDIRLSSEYRSKDCDVAKEFYVPVMSNCVRFDRVSCYFSPKALSQYAIGLYNLGKTNHGKYRLMISTEVSKETFGVIHDGYAASLLVDEDIREKMVAELDQDDLTNLSNLAYLMECGIVEVKFAICRSGGLFHVKSGYVEDAEGNAIYFLGSNNETAESINDNYEAFGITASWLSSDFDRVKITEGKKRFEEEWAGQAEDVMVIDPPDSFEQFLEAYNRGRLLGPADDPGNEAFVMDYDGAVILRMPPSVIYPNSMKYRLSVMSHLERIDGHRMVFDRKMTRDSARQVSEKVKGYCRLKEQIYFETGAFRAYLAEMTALEKMAKVGISIKRHDHIHDEALYIFRSEVDSFCERRLNEAQLWNAYYLFVMKRAANFSVPGSGKTATALGLFAYLYKTGIAKRLVVIGPLNSLSTWEYEFRAVFGKNLPLVSMNITDLRDSAQAPECEIRFNSGRANLILINYEAFDHNPDLLRAISDRLDERSLLVFDEVHRIKNVNGKRAAKLLSLGERAGYVVVMTGTPVPNDYSDVYNFLHILYNDEYDSFFALSPEMLSSLEGNDVDVINQKLQPFFCRTTKDELGVPKANPDDIIRVDATAIEGRLFEMLPQRVTSPLAMIIRILQLESDPVMLSGKVSDLELSAFADEGESPDFGDFGEEITVITAKTAACLDLVTELASQGKKVVVWCIFVRSIENLARMLKAKGISVCMVYGGTEDREAALDSFKNGSVQVLVTNPQTLAEAISLHTACHDAVYFEYSYNLVHLLQSKDRIHRLGLKEDQYTQFHYLETVFDQDGVKVSLDEQILTRLGRKEKVMLEAIENDSLERFTTTRKEQEEILASIGMMPKRSLSDSHPDSKRDPLAKNVQSMS